MLRAALGFCLKCREVYGHSCTLPVLPSIIVKLSHQIETAVSTFQWGHPTPGLPQSPLEWRLLILLQGRTEGQSPTPPALSSRFYGIWSFFLKSLALNTSYRLIFSDRVCKMPSTSSEPPRNFLPHSCTDPGKTAVFRIGPGSLRGQPDLPRKKPAIHPNPSAQPPSSPCQLATTCHS